MFAEDDNIGNILLILNHKSSQNLKCILSGMWNDNEITETPQGADENM